MLRDFKILYWKTRNSRINSEKGFALIMAMILGFLALLIITPLLGFTVTGLKTAPVFEKRTSELYAADAGVDDAYWQIKYGNIANLKSSGGLSYAEYDFANEFVDDMSTRPVNENGTTITPAVTLQNIWIPRDVAPPSASQAEAIIQANKLIVTGNTMQTGIDAQDQWGNPIKISQYQIRVSYYPATGETLHVNTLGIWFPHGVEYFSDSTHQSSLEPGYPAPAIQPYDGNQSIVWTLNKDFNSLPGVNPQSSPLDLYVTFYFAPISKYQLAGQTDFAPQGVPWITTSASGIPFAWNADIKVFKIASMASETPASAGTKVETFVAKSQLRTLQSAIAGDYYATGNSLLSYPTSGSYTRCRTVRHDPSSAAVTSANIPADADVASAFLYWSAWKNSYSNLFNDVCSTFNNWTVVSPNAWSVNTSYFRGHYSNGNNTDISLNSSQNLSAYASSGGLTVSWDQWVTTPGTSFVNRGATSQAASGNVIPALPSGWQVNDLLICAIASRDNISSTMPAGWTAIDPGTNNGTGLRTASFYRRAQAGDINPSVTHTGGSYISAVIVAYRGIVTTDPPTDVIGTTSVNNSSSTMTFGNITTATDNDLVVEIGGTANQATSSNYSGSPTPTERADVPNASNYPEVVIADFTLSPQGSTGARTSRLSTARASNGKLVSFKTVQSSSSDGLDFALSGDGGNTWSSNIQAFRGSITTSQPSSNNFTYTIPSQYLTSGFRIRFSLVRFSGAGQYCNLDNIKITATSPQATCNFQIDDGTGAKQVSFDANGQPQLGGQLSASKTQTEIDDLNGPHGFSYSCFRDVTALVRKYSQQPVAPATNIPGYATYWVGGVDADTAWTNGIPDEISYAGWSLIIIYTSLTTQGHMLYIYDKFANSGQNKNVDFDDDGKPGGTISGFIVPQRVTDQNGNPEVNAAKITCFVGEGDAWYTGDYLAINGTKLWDGITTTDNSVTNPDNDWNSASSIQVAPGVQPYDGIDVDTLGLDPPNGNYITWDSGILKEGDTSAQIDIWTQQDMWNLVYMILSFRSKIITGGEQNFLINNPSP